MCPFLKTRNLCRYFQLSQAQSQILQILLQSLDETKQRLREEFWQFSNALLETLRRIFCQFEEAFHANNWKEYTLYKILVTM